MQSDGAPRSFLQRFGMRLHLVVCNWCRRYGRQIRFLQRFAHDGHEHFPQPSLLSNDARERLRQSLREKSGVDAW